ncbi:MAG: AbrB/MazE/SpoVT family DNA-binding domain-containing protein [Methylobacter sp.]|nr:AbrB/MazE/SpoVT family DNA-binding domain-containing protein [Methylobacter sp.]
MELAIRRIGNSAGVIPPKEALNRLRLDKGDKLYLTETEDGYKLTPYIDEFAKQLSWAEKRADLVL